MHVESNYLDLITELEKTYNKVDGLNFYKVIFPNNENVGEFNSDYSKPNAVYLYKDEKDTDSKRTLRRRIMLQDSFELDFEEYVMNNSKTLCSGLSYRGRRNRIENAQHCNALIFDLDHVGLNELKTLFLRIGKEPGYRTLPQPTFIVVSGTGLHLYYVFEEPIELYPNIKIQLKSLKYDLTFTLWDYKSTTKEKQIQYQSINQSFRMVGSMNDKYNLEVVAFKTGELVDIETLNQYVIEDKNKVDLNKPFAPTKYTLEEAKEKFPDWYQRVIIDKNKNQNKWHIKKDLYNWWKNQYTKIKGGHRYYFLMCMSIYAVKCDVPKRELKKDMFEIYEKVKLIEHTNPLTKEDVHSALEIYDRAYYNFKIDDIIKLTDIQIQKNKRNYRTQKEHLQRTRAVQVIDYPNGEWRGNQSKEKIVKDFIKNNPDKNPSQIARELNISRTTVYKYLN